MDCLDADATLDVNFNYTIELEREREQLLSEQQLVVLRTRCKIDHNQPIAW